MVQKASVNSDSIMIEDIRPKDLFEKFSALSYEDALSFFDKKAFVETLCPSCLHSLVTKDCFEKHSFNYKHCATCDSIYASPRPTAHQLQDYYANSRSQKLWSSEILAKTTEERQQFIIMPALEKVRQALANRSCFSPSAIIDVGAGNGKFLYEFGKVFSGTKLIAIEPGGASSMKCKDLGLEVWENTVEEVAKADALKSDLVTCFEVLEHVQDVEVFLEAIFKITDNGGTAILSCLGSDGFDIQTLWDKARCICPPYHLNFLSKTAYKKILERIGFEDVQFFTPGRMDVQIVEKALEENQKIKLDKFTTKLLSSSAETKKSFQEFLASNGLSSHLWIIAKRPL